METVLSFSKILRFIYGKDYVFGTASKLSNECSKKVMFYDFPTFSLNVNILGHFQKWIEHLQDRCHYNDVVYSLHIQGVFHSLSWKWWFTKIFGSENVSFYEKNCQVWYFSSQLIVQRSVSVNIREQQIVVTGSFEIHWNKTSSVSIEPSGVQNIRYALHLSSSFKCTCYV